MGRSPSFHARAKLAIVAAIAAVVGVAFSPAILASHNDNHIPANKIVAGASSIEIMSTAGNDEEDSAQGDLLTEVIRLSAPADLIIEVALECTLVTDITTVGSDDSEAIATANVWIELDGAVIPITPDEDPEREDFGEVVFCNRAYQRVTTLFDDEDATIETFFETRSAHGFTWVVPNPGAGLHDLVVMGEVESQVNGVGEATAVIGHRTVTVEAVKLL